MIHFLDLVDINEFIFSSGYNLMENIEKPVFINHVYVRGSGVLEKKIHVLRFIFKFIYSIEK